MPIHSVVASTASVSWRGQALEISVDEEALIDAVIIAGFGHLVPARAIASIDSTSTTGLGVGSSGDVGLIGSETVYWPADGGSVVRGAGLMPPAAHSNETLYRVVVDPGLSLIVRRLALRVEAWADMPGAEPYDIIGEDLRPLLAGFRRPDALFLHGGYGSGAPLSAVIPASPVDGGGGGGGSLTPQQLFSMISPMFAGASPVTLEEDALQRRITISATLRTPAEIADALEGLTGDDRLAASAIRGLPAPGLASVSSDGTLTGGGTAGDPLGVARPFTAADEAKLDGIEAGAQANPARAGAFTAADEAKLDGIEAGAEANPEHVVSFRAQDGNPDGLPAGVVGFLRADNTQWQSGAASESLAAIALNPAQFSLTQDPTNPASIPGYTGWHSLPDNIAEKRGSTIWSFYYGGAGIGFPDDPSLIVQAETIVRNDDGSYALQNITVLKDYTLTGQGYNWQVSGAFAPPSGADAIVGRIAWGKLRDIPPRVGAFTAGDEASLDELVSETDAALGSYTRVASASSLAAGQFHLDGTTIQLVSASGHDVHPYWHNGDVFTLGAARFVLSGASTLGANRVYGAISDATGIPAVNASGALVHKGVLARTTDLARVARTGEYGDLRDRPDVVTREELEGRETDRYFSFTNAENDYWPGTIKFYDQTSGAPDVANLIRQPDIAAGDITVAVGTPRLDRDPNHLQFGPQYEASDFASGQVYYLRDWNAKTDSGTLTLTSGGTVVGSGSARRVYFRATLALVGTDLADVRDDGNYWRFAAESGTSLDVRLPAGDVLAPPWARTDGTNVTNALIDAIQGDNETVDLDNTYRVDATNVDYYASLSESGVLNIGTIRLPSSAAGSADDLRLTRLVKERNWVDIGGYVIDVTTNATRSIIGTSLTFVFNYTVVSGTKPTGSTPRSVSVYGEDVHRGEVARAAFKGETPSIDGTGGADDNLWARVAGKGAWATLTSLAVAIRQAMETLTGDSRLDATAIKGAPRQPAIHVAGDGGGRHLDGRADREVSRRGVQRDRVLEHRQQAGRIDSRVSAG